MATATNVTFRPVRVSLRDVAGADWADAVARARAFVSGESEARVRARLAETVDFYPAELQARMRDLLPRVGVRVVHGLSRSASGATSAAFAAASRTDAAPLTGFGHFRVGEDGRLYLVTKSEHYHASMGHAFPGYRLVDVARSVGVPNATHNNTRGHLTRLLEEELVRAAGGRGGALDRVLNLETGSLAVEAALKMALARFYRVRPDSPEPRYAGRVPVVVVIGDESGGPAANYHGTSVLTQVMRGMWPHLGGALGEGGVLRVRSVRANDIVGLEEVFGECDSGREKVAAFLHELVLMNYGAKVLSREFVARAYELCRAHDVPTIDDEIQSCMWAPGLFLFREYGIEPTCVILGKGFPGGEFPASRVIFGEGIDSLPQFGALVTNGQEELASLAYLVTMRWATANAEVTRVVGERYEERLRELGRAHARLVSAVEGRRHMMALHFDDLRVAREFASALNERGIDISVQTYKSSVPPAALTKLPLTAGPEVGDFVAARMDEALRNLAPGAKDGEK